MTGSTTRDGCALVRRDLVGDRLVAVEGPEAPPGPIAPGRAHAQPDLRTVSEHVAEREQLDPDLRELIGGQRLRVGLLVRVPRAQLGRAGTVEGAVARPQPAALHVGLLAVGSHLGERHLDVGVRRARLEPEVDAARADHREVRGQRLARVRDGGALDERLPRVRRQRCPQRLRPSRRGGSCRAGRRDRCGTRRRPRPRWVWCR